MPQGFEIGSLIEDKCQPYFLQTKASATCDPKRLKSSLWCMGYYR